MARAYIVHLAAILTLFPSSASLAGEVRRLTGWQNMQFGMSAEEVRAATKLPLKCVAPLHHHLHEAVMLYSVATTIDGYPVELQLNFSSLTRTIQGCTGGTLSIIHMNSGAIREPCLMMNELRRYLSQTYGQLNVIDSGQSSNGTGTFPTAFGRYFGNSARLFVEAMDKEDGCNFEITFSAPSTNY
ncbi:hypothetical protein [Lichenicoccus roseus]|uniref:Uncharacterized protein n=1 Tax=Lichenicoccus roseus TaxID=2683649 RepID=A0A5R9J1N5_9PROT|nr:hypothetical protein [Lichenicoccus roseus]TLU71550.1 hypothetical protein FE263_16885 [Lichenicoccus roseus]